MARYGYGGYYGGWAPYVSVAERRRKAQSEMAKLRKKGVDIQPVTIEGRKIARSFWGEAWCKHLESFSDFANRLPRGQRYARNGSVCHLAVGKGRIEAKVSGSKLYDVVIQIKTLAPAKWNSLKSRCAGRIGSLLELLEGRLSEQVMEQVTDRKDGLFPQPGEISMKCSCPDWATMCKHVAAVLYGVGARLDHKPEMLFLLRGVDHQEIIAADAEQAVTEATSRGKSKRLSAGALADVFGIEINSPDAKTDSQTALPAGGSDRTAPAKPSRSRTRRSDAAAGTPPRTLSRPTKKKTAAKSAANRIKTAIALAEPESPAETPVPRSVKKQSAATTAKKSTARKVKKRQSLKDRS
ncbi:MAG: hypothetical protein KJZ87_03550 [Thermoguttaceae bacterium]|nr:hypothetical protein [Thermoguttaceae bacterium]